MCICLSQDNKRIYTILVALEERDSSRHLDVSYYLSVNLCYARLIVLESVSKVHLSR